jgi:hypothetical protein
MNAPGLFQYLNPRRDACSGPPPKNSTIPIKMSPMMVINLILANQNSASPKKGTAMMLRSRIVIRMMVIQTPGFMSASCYRERLESVVWQFTINGPNSPSSSAVYFQLWILLQQVWRTHTSSSSLLRTPAIDRQIGRQSTGP